MRNRWHKQVCLYRAVEKRDKIQARVSKGLIMLKILVGGRKKLKKKMLSESGKKYLTVNLSQPRVAIYRLYVHWLN